MLIIAGAHRRNGGARRAGQDWLFASLHADSVLKR